MTTINTNKQNFIALVKNLAPFFPDYDLTIQEDYYCGAASFTSKQDKSKGFWLSVRDDKFNVSPHIIKTPRHSFDLYVNNEKVNSPTAGFSINRPAEQIAKGIKTRFFPDFEVYFKLWTEKWNQMENHENHKVSVIKEIAEILDADTTDYVRGGIRENLSAYHSKNKGLKEYVREGNVSSPNYIEVKINSLNIEQTKKLLEFIKGL